VKNTFTLQQTSSSTLLLQSLFIIRPQKTPESNSNTTITL